MMFMNRCEIEEARDRHCTHPVLRKAAQLLYDLMELADDVSDGWCHWRKPSAAAQKLQALIKARSPATTEADLRKAVTPIKAFLTREAKNLQGRTLTLPR